MKDISRREFGKLAAGVLGFALAGGAGYAAGRGFAEQGENNLWPEAALLEAGGSKLIGRDTVNYDFQRGDGHRGSATLNVQAYRLPYNPFYGDDVTSIAMISQGRSESASLQEHPFYGSSVVFLPTGGVLGAYPNGDTEGEHVFDFGWKLKLGVSNFQKEQEAFYPRVYGVDFSWGQQQVPSSEDLDLLKGFNKTMRYPVRLVEVPQIVEVAPGRHDVIDTPCVLYAGEYGYGPAGQRTVPLPAAELVDRNKRQESNFIIVDIGNTKLVRGLGRDYSVRAANLLSYDRVWVIDEVDAGNNRVIFRAGTSLNSYQDIIAEVTLGSRDALNSLVAYQNEQEYFSGFIFEIEYGGSDERPIKSLGGLPVYKGGLSIFSTDLDSPYLFDLREGVSNFQIALENHGEGLKA